MKRYKNKLEIENELLHAWNLPEPTAFEIRNWIGKYPLKVSLNFLIGQEIINRKNRNVTGEIAEINFNKNGLDLIDTKGKCWKITNSFVNIINPFTHKKELIPLFRRPGCLNILETGYYLNQKDFKSLYYETLEYQQKYKNTLKEKYNANNNMDIPGVKDKISSTIKERYGVDWFLKRGDHYKSIDNSMIEKYGVKHPIQNNDIKNNISSTMKEKYNVDWFLKRGEHYKKIERIMVSKYGVVNIFSLTGIYFPVYYTNANSKVEFEFFEKLIANIKFNKPECLNVTNNQKIFIRQKHNYIVDFYDETENLIIEFYGDFWHCNPNKYDSNYFHPYKKMLAKEVWAKDQKRKQELISVSGAQFIEVWENDWKNNSDKVIQEIKNSLKK